MIHQIDDYVWHSVDMWKVKYMFTTYHISAEIMFDNSIIHFVRYKTNIYESSRI